MERRYVLVHTHPEGLVLSPRLVEWFQRESLLLVDPIEFDRYSLQKETFTNPYYCHNPKPIADALGDPNIEVVCLCLRTRDRYGEASRLGMTVVEVHDLNEAHSRAQDLLPRVEMHTYTDDDGKESAPYPVTYWEKRAHAAEQGS
jgi:hypothetical protein